MDMRALVRAANEVSVPMSVAKRLMELYVAEVTKQNRLAALAKNHRVRLLASMAVDGWVYWEGPMQSSFKYRARELMEDPNARWERDGQKLVRVR